MNVKLYQIVDTIHGTIYYTNLEKNIISTPFFNRLHDVNQSSTVYLTFPPNRTKRYEHSLGTMQLTSEVFRNATVNSMGDESMDLLIEYADKAFRDVIKNIKDGSGKLVFSYKEKTFRTMDNISSKKEEEIVQLLEEQFLTVFHGNCLLNYAPSGLNIGYKAFLFLCLIQSLRIVGLLHDVGHPPQSHIIESVLEEIDYELRGYSQLNDRQKKFISILSSYKDINHKSIAKIDKEMGIKTIVAKKEHLHEMIGIQIIKRIVEIVFPDLIERSIIEGKDDIDIINVAYYITIIEFVFAIVRNKSSFWIGLHSIIDGTIDTDRLDFVPRDSQNSGMIWGKVPYKRLINTVKFGIVSDSELDKSIYVCFSDKNIQQMDDLLNNRYKIFTMINYHHRSTKIASLYQRAVKLLAVEYLDSTEQDTKEGFYFSDISGLWRTIEIAYSQEALVLNFIQWNDSWLNGLLYRHMIEESKNKSKNPRMNQCCEYLREIFLNEHHHFSLIKRQTEMSEINEQVADVIEELVDEIGDELIAVQKELTGIYHRIEESNKNGTNTRKSTIEKMQKKEEAFRILLNIYEALNKLDWPTIEVNLGITLVSEAIERVMKRHKTVVKSYIVEKVKFSLGTGNAYVYDYDGNVESYYRYSNIKEVLTEARLGFPFYYVYLNFFDDNKVDKAFLSSLRKEIGKEIGEAIKLGVKNNIDFDSTKRK